MEGHLNIDKGKLTLQWRDGKFKKRGLVSDAEFHLVAEALGVTALPTTWPPGLALLPVTFDQTGGRLTRLAVTASAASKADWTAVAAVVPVIERRTRDELRSLIIDRLGGQDLVSDLITSIQLDAIFDDVIGACNLPPVDIGFAYLRWANQFATAVDVARNTHASQLRTTTEPETKLDLDVPLDGFERFRNPFHYVPTPPRSTTVAELADLGDVGLTTIGHHRAREDRFSGQLSVRFHIDTPALILDHERPEPLGNDHFGFHITVDPAAANAPVIQPTTPRGLVRSLVRAVTNSRFQTTPSGLDAKRGGYRLGTSAAKRLVPCRLQHNAGQWTAELFIGTSPNLAPDGLAQHHQHAAWLRQQLLNPERNQQQLIAHHGITVDARVRPTRHQRNFSFWQVIQIRQPGQPWGPVVDNPTARHTRTSDQVTEITGIVFATGRTASNKHDERLFFNIGPAPTRNVAADVINDFSELLRNYRTLERDSDIPSPHKPPYIDGAWGVASDGLTVLDGTLCFALVEQGQVASLHPALLPRALHDASLASTIHTSLLPADSTEQLSPADRMFGWANNNGSGALRSRVSVSSVDTSDLVVTTNNSAVRWLPLDVQSTPKNSPRFAGSPGTNGVPYAPVERQNMRWNKLKNAPMGHKMWLAPTGPEYRRSWFAFERNMDAVYQRGPAPPDQSDNDNQNQSIDSWINNGSFTVTLAVKDLSTFELGALLWLFHDPTPTGQPVRYRIGYAKSLSFGVIRPQLIDTRLSTTSALQQFWRALDDSEPQYLDAGAVPMLADGFATTMNATHPGVLGAFDQLRRGYSDKFPLTPPRAYTDRRIDQEGRPDKFWHSLNESTASDKGGQRSLGPVINNPGLKFFTRPPVR